MLPRHGHRSEGRQHPCEQIVPQHEGRPEDRERGKHDARHDLIVAEEPGNHGARQQEGLRCRSGYHEAGKESIRLVDFGLRLLLQHVGKGPPHEHDQRAEHERPRHADRSGSDGDDDRTNDGEPEDDGRRADQAIRPVPMTTGEMASRHRENGVGEHRRRSDEPKRAPAGKQPAAESKHKRAGNQGNEAYRQLGGRRKWGLVGIESQPSDDDLLDRQQHDREGQEVHRHQLGKRREIDCSEHARPPHLERVGTKSGKKASGDDIDRPVAGEPPKTIRISRPIESSNAHCTPHATRPSRKVGE